VQLFCKTHTENPACQAVALPRRLVKPHFACFPAGAAVSDTFQSKVLRKACNTFPKFKPRAIAHCRPNRPFRLLRRPAAISNCTKDPAKPPDWFPPEIPQMSSRLQDAEKRFDGMK